MTVAEVIGDEIIVTLPLTSYTVAYRKHELHPRLPQTGKVASNSS